MTSDPKQPDGGSDEPLDRKLREVLDETETAEPRATPVPAHVTIEGYDIIRELHRGGQGVVYEAVQKSTRRKVAIKILLEGRFASSSARRRFQREVTLAAGLKHPNIIAIFDSGETPDGHQFCVMDYVRGRSIRSHVRQNKLALEETLELFSSVCEAAHFAHLKGVIHRDLKPSNIIVDTDGVPRLLDFGLARQLAGGEQSLVSITGQVVGTLPYMSPEQTRGNPDEIDARSDVYSLGVILYELLTGTHPYPVKGEMYEVVKHITGTEPTPPSKVWTAETGVSKRKSRRFRAGQCPIDNELQTIVFKALSKNRERRYQSAEALRQDIISYLAGEPIEAKRDSSLYVLRKSLRRHRTKIAVMAGFVVVTATALYVGSRTGTREAPGLALTGPITSLAVLPLENLSGDPDQEFFADGMTAELITALGKIRALKVISRRSVMGYKDTEKSSADIARELNVEALVEGTVTRFGNRVRIAANLIRAATSEQLWGESYERDMRDVLAMQGEIARAIADQIQAKLTPQEQARLGSAPSVNPDAYQAYLRGLDRVERPDYSEEDHRLAIRMFERAVRLDPDFALAYAGLSKAHSVMHHEGHDTTEERAAMAKAGVDLALELQPDLPEAHLALGYYHYRCHRDYDRALEEFAVAERDLPNDSRILEAVGYVRRRQGNFKVALDHLKRAFELSPREADLAHQLGSTYTRLRYYAEADNYYDRSISLVPDQMFAYMSKAINYWLWKGDLKRGRAALEEIPTSLSDYTLWTWFRLEVFERNYQSALDRLAFTPGESFEFQDGFIPKSQLAGLVHRLMGESKRSHEAYDTARILLEEEVKKRPDDHRLHSSLGVVYAALGRKEDAIREGKLGVELFPVSKDALIGPYREEDLAFIYTLAGQYDAVMDQIERLLSIPNEVLSVPLLRLDPRWDPLRDHPRYKDLLRRHGFEPEPQSQSTAKPPDGKIMLAVLPLLNLSNDPEQEYFSDGMTEEMITRLGRLQPEKLGVIARTSAMQYKNTVKTIEEIGRELGVAYVVEGGVRRSGNSVRINVQLIQVSDQTQLWGDSYTRELSDVFAIQAEVAEAVAKSLAVELLPQHELAQVEPPTASSAAHNAYLLGRHYWAKRTPKALYTAIEHFERAVMLDPNYALAYSGLANAWGVLPWYVPGPYNQIYAEAKRAAERALALDDSLAEAHVAMAGVYEVRRDLKSAESHYRNAVALDPNNATAHQWYGYILSLQGRHGAAVKEFESAITLDPLSPVMHEDYGFGMLLARRFDKAIEQNKKALELEPEFFNAARWLMWASIGKGDHDAAAAWFERYLRLIHHPMDAVTTFRRTYEISGLRAGFVGLLDSQGSTEDVPGPAMRAAIYAWCNEKDRAFEWLERAFERQVPVVFSVASHPAFDNLHDDPRFDDLLRKMGLDQVDLSVPPTTP